MFDLLSSGITLEDVILDLRISATVIAGLFAIFLLLRSRKEIQLLRRKGQFWAGVFYSSIVLGISLVAYFDLDVHTLFLDTGLIGLAGLFPVIFGSIWILKYMPLSLSSKNSHNIQVLLLIYFIFQIFMSVFPNPLFDMIRSISPIFITTLITLLVIFSLTKVNIIYNLPRPNFDYLYAKKSNFIMSSIGLIFSFSIPLYLLYLHNLVGYMLYLYLYGIFIFGLVLLVIASFNEIIASDTYSYGKYMEIVENANIAIVQLNNNLKITYFNQKFNQFLRGSLKKGQEYDFLTFIHSDDFDKVKRFICNKKHTPNYTNELDFTIEDNKSRILTDVRMIRPIHRNTAAQGDDLTFYLWDITKEKKFEEIQERFIAMTSHELSTPLSIIEGYLEILNNREVTPRERKIIHQSLNRNVKRLETLILNVRGFSRVSRNLFTLEPIEIDFERFFCEVIEPNLLFLHPKRLVFSCFTNYSQDKMIYIDAGLIEQIVNNLVSNAIKNSPKDSIVGIKISLTARMLTIIVEDFGCGIPQNVLFRLGEPFLHLSTEYSATGTGLGLYIVKNIVFSYNGTLEIHTRVDHFTTFCIKIPRVKKVLA